VAVIRPARDRPAIKPPVACLNDAVEREHPFIRIRRKAPHDREACAVGFDLEYNAGILGPAVAGGAV